MNLLLDTQVLLWWLADDACLGESARDAIADPENAIWVSVASAWEIAIKVALGRLSLPEPAAQSLQRALAKNDFSPLPISLDHALAVAGLPRLHGDPFDRMLIVQAVAESLTIVTADAIFGRYGVPVTPCPGKRRR
jgi:PIN domain nuclease of toxin-antitoxin system